MGKKKSINPANLLLDLQQELQGHLLEDTFEVYGRSYTMRLLSEEETIWTYGFLNPKSTLSIAVAARLANISIGLRAIEGVPIEEVFKPVWEALTEDEQSSLRSEDPDPKMVYPRLVMDWLRKQPSEFMNRLHQCWQELEERRVKSQDEVKNLSGESSEKEEKQNLTELSQSGEQ